MKFNELEKKIKAEAERIDVPDVYPRVKLSSINALSLGVSPLQAFRKNLAVWMLALTLGIFAVMSISLFAFWLTPSTPLNSSGSFVIITVTGADGIENKVDFVTDGGRIVCAYDEVLDAEADEMMGLSPSDAVARMLPAGEGYTVRVAVLNDKPSRAGELAGTLGEVIKSYYGDNESAVTLAVADARDKAAAVDLILAKQGSADINESVEGIIAAFSDLFAEKDN